MRFDDRTLWGRDDEMDEYSDSGAYGESLEDGHALRNLARLANGLDRNGHSDAAAAGFGHRY